MDFSLIYFIVSIIISIIGILIFGIADYDNYSYNHNMSKYNIIAGTIFVSFLWPMILFVGILTLVVMGPIWIFYQIGRLIGKIIFRKR